MTFRQIITQAADELVAEHRPTWASDAMRDAGRDPIGCVICYPADGHWPCVSRMIADDLRAAVKEEE